MSRVFFLKYVEQGLLIILKCTMLSCRSKSGLPEEQEYKASELRHMTQAPRIRWSTEPVLCWARKGGTVNLATQRHPLRLMTFSNHDDLPSLLKELEIVLEEL
uniref:Uncharacterized protein n=1 Tax=Triticum urartu TaxID=4572 RepID=A0A8R7R5J8_TRIUA